MPRAKASESTKLFGSRLKTRREALGFEKKQLGQMVGLTHSAIWKYEEGLQGPNVEIIVRLADALQCTTDYLYGRTDLPDYVLISGDQVPQVLRDKNVDAVEILRTQVQEDGGITPAAQHEVLRIVSQARLLRNSKPRKPKPDLQDSSNTPEQ